jgi:hypothetical protein
MRRDTSETGRAFDDGLEDIAGHYSAAFPSADIERFRAHLAVLRTGTRLSQSVSQFLAANFGINTARYCCCAPFTSRRETSASERHQGHERDHPTTQLSTP